MLLFVACHRREMNVYCLSETSDSASPICPGLCSRYIEIFSLDMLIVSLECYRTVLEI